ncbi:MAG: AEC family transporter [Oscillospiraceae bacterium]|nr:AEC family transporter [Oscillospiraceae bacterium]
MNSFGNILLFSFNAIAPLLVLILLGLLLRKIGLLSDGFLKCGNKLVFYVLTPALLFCNIYSMESLSDLNWSAVLFSLVVVFVLFGIGWGLSFLTKDPKQKGVLMQCTFRSNNALIGLPLAESLVGLQNLGAVSAISAFAIPEFNVLAVIALSLFVGADGSRPTTREVLRKVLKNPLILGVAAGLGALALRAVLPLRTDGTAVFSLQRDLSFLYSAISQLARSASPTALLLLGGGFRFSAIRGVRRQIAIGTVARLVIAPLIGVGSAVLLSEVLGLVHFDAQVYAALVALFASPVAVNSAIMAEEMHNDSQLAGQLVVWTSIFSIFTLFFLIAALRMLGLL